MTDQTIRQIRINGHPVGIAGLDAILQSMAINYASRPDDEVGAEMVRRLEATNYIPKGARDLYAKALVREFRTCLGQPAEEEAVSGLHVVVLGPGCAQCDRMEMDVLEIMAEMELAASLDHITDPREIGRYGVLGVPALIINGKVVCVGQAPNRNRIREWLSEAVKSL